MTIIVEGRTQKKKAKGNSENLNFNNHHFKCYTFDMDPSNSNSSNSNSNPFPASSSSISQSYNNAKDANSIQLRENQEQFRNESKRRKDFNYKCYKCFTRSWRKLILFTLPIVLSPLIYSAPDDTWILVN